MYKWLMRGFQLWPHLDWNCLFREYRTLKMGKMISQLPRVGSGFSKLAITKTVELLDINDLYNLCDPGLWSGAFYIVPWLCYYMQLTMYYSYRFLVVIDLIKWIWLSLVQTLTKGPQLSLNSVNWFSVE
jgi:hypothetical protein